MRVLEKAVPNDVYHIDCGLLVNIMSALNLQGQKIAIHPLQTKAMTASAKNIPICRLGACPANFINMGANSSLPAIQWLPGVNRPYKGSL
ncbi:MAG: hypothetical protein PHR16_18020 [Methylovulum sp.]|nr:hypothetical protein [Methylovulum sp.]